MDKKLEMNETVENPEGTPTTPVKENTPEYLQQYADPGLVLFYKDYEDRVLWINKDIDETLFYEIRMITYWNREDDKNKIPPKKRKPITLLIHTYGGELDSCYALLDTMNSSITPIRTVNTNKAMSCGCLILMNGHKGMRYCMKLSSALLHEGSGGQQGSYGAVMAQTEDYKHTIEMMKENIMSHSSIDAKTLSKWKNKEVYLYAEDQLKYNIVDKVVNKLTDIF